MDHVTTTREEEEEMLVHCAKVANGEASPINQKESNVCRVAALVIRSSLPDESSRLMSASENYFLAHPNDRLPAESVIENGWVISLPRLRDMLILKLDKN